MSVNKAILVGRVGSDPETINYEGGKLYKLSVATNEYWVSKEGERKESTEWHRIVLGGRFEKVMEHVKKGERLYIEGRIKTKAQKKGDGTVYHTNIEVDKLELL